MNGRNNVHSGKSDGLKNQIGKEQEGVFSPKRQKDGGNNEQAEEELDKGAAKEAICIFIPFFSGRRNF